MDYKVVKDTRLVEAFAELGANIKKSSLQSGSWDGPYAVAAIVIDHVRPDAEVHEKASDVWVVLKGNGVFILGGALKDEKRTGDNELTGTAVEGGECFEVGAGDVIDILPGVPHQVDALKGRLELLIIKVAQ
ncbi:MAG: hypothetical protein HYT40_00040 [Candidatus Sungbacteria bacterium]|uniref:Cupin n=1 Tax=Candidatus Sungiibacteriota bacterium TaxID=2750080 RepID=A0A931SCU3_9BACT|nr:hypothetical protein [Candidatus Sungbacteria bacterium]